MIYTLTIPGLRLPTLNVVLGWNWRRRAKEVKRVREAVAIAAIRAGYANAIPLRKAHVKIRAYGPYERRDSDATVLKAALDAIVAGPLYARIGRQKLAVKGEREWGLIVNDDRRTIGDADLGTVVAKKYRVVIEVRERGTNGDLEAP